MAHVADADIDSSVGQPSQVTLKTAFTVCFAVLAVAVFAVLIVKTEAALILTGLAALFAMALDHLVSLLVQRARFRRSSAISVVLAAVLIVLTALALIVVPAAITQGEALAREAPELIEKVRTSRFFQLVDQRFNVLEQLQRKDQNPAELASGALPPLLDAVTGAFSLVGAIITVVFLMVFMLIFGPGLVQRVLAQALPERRPRYERVLDKMYSATGGYLSGLTLICSINALLTSTCLALLGMPFFLPLGIASGFSSLVPYAGPIVAGGFVTLLTLATAGVWKALLVFVYFVLYGVTEGNVLAPLVFRRTVHVNPLLTLFAVVFFGELAGIIGAVMAVPLMATAQIILRELLLIRREKLGDRVPVP
ncbi:AI-2E family transporter [Cystobacter ferrugineus]|uniref:AI-2E family transporter n=1 Tax=Cystobacter ferrugineus TaxID=83449 RepID=A0A1L9BDN3_9BACT|nr:AI-2E family transporter [Cystobacter ferrugineus]